jgi:hypothetical protein
LCTVEIIPLNRRLNDRGVRSPKTSPATILQLQLVSRLRPLAALRVVFAETLQTACERPLFVPISFAFQNPELRKRPAIKSSATWLGSSGLQAWGYMAPLIFFAVVPLRPPYLSAHPLDLCDFATRQHGPEKGRVSLREGGKMSLARRGDLFGSPSRDVRGLQKEASCL